MQHFPASPQANHPKLLTPEFARVNRSATASLGFGSNRDYRSGTETDSPSAQAAASRLRGQSQTSNSLSLKHAAEGMIYSKNNVCVHSTLSSPSASPGTRSKHAETVHVPGYLSLRCRGQSVLGVGSSLILHWIPNVLMTSAAYGTGDNLAVEASPHRAATAQSTSFTSSMTSGFSASDSDSVADGLPKDVSTFTVDLGQMRSVKVFYNQDDRSCGQLVVASMSKQFRVLHFHHGGLPGLASAMDDWPMCSRAQPRNVDVSRLLSDSHTVCCECRNKALGVREIHWYLDINFFADFSRSGLHCCVTKFSINKFGVPGLTQIAMQISGVLCVF